MALQEEEIIRRLLRGARRLPARGVRLGIGDDTAVVHPAEGEELLITTDQVIEDTHFIRGRHPPAALGRKILARGLSDVAAMGGAARWFLLSLGVPAGLDPQWLASCLQGLLRFAKSAETALIGGDVARAPGFSADVTVIGAAPLGRALTRGGARDGDPLYVSGRLGGSALGFERLRAGQAAERDKAVRRHTSPEPRLALGPYLRELPATAAIDLSDGLSTDLARLAKASGLGAEIEADRIPVFAGANFEQALHGGEEYELLFTAAPGVKVPSVWRRLKLTRIGRMVRSRGLWLREGPARRRLVPQGFEHLE